MRTLQHTTDLVVTACWCGIAHAIPSSLMQIADEDHRHAVYCPLGHAWVVTGKTEAERLRERLEEEKRRRQAARDLLAAEERSHAATRGHLTRQKKRAAAGVCPCCDRTFQQLSRHMANKHPEFVAEVSA